MKPNPRNMKSETVPATIIMATGCASPRFIVQYRWREPPDPNGDAFARACFFAEGAPDEGFDDWDHAVIAAREWITGAHVTPTTSMQPSRPRPASGPARDNNRSLKANGDRR